MTKLYGSGRQSVVQRGIVRYPIMKIWRDRGGLLEHPEKGQPTMPEIVLLPTTFGVIGLTKVFVDYLHPDKDYNSNDLL